VQVVDDDHDGPRRALVGGKRDELLGEDRGHVRAAVGGHLAAQQPGDGLPPRVRRHRANLERVEERQERKLLSELVAIAPEQVPARPRAWLWSGLEGRAHERGLADSWLALDEQRATAAAAQLF